MLDRMSSLSQWSVNRLEESLLPAHGSLVSKIAKYATQLFQFSIFFPFAIITNSLFFTFRKIFAVHPIDSPLLHFAKHPTWETSSKHAPVDIGFATAEFQDNGPHIHPDTNWGNFYFQNMDKVGQIDKVPDTWNYPEKVVERLVELGVKKYRFSISRDKIESTQGTPYDQMAMDRYRTFCRLLKAHDIEPMVTVHHFSQPLYFNWENKEDVEGFIRFTEDICDLLYEEGVRKIVTLNEPAIVSMLGWVLGEFPPHKKLDVKGAAQILENMMYFHVQIYDRLKAKYSDLEIGISHDPLRFRTFHKSHPIWAPLEKMVCRYLTEINHKAFFRFFQTGVLSMKIPFLVNHFFDFKRKPPLDFIGLQYYTDPLIQFPAGKSVTREKEKLTSYEYRKYPQGLASALEECSSLNVPIDLTEIGIDTGINFDDSDQERIAYFDKIFQVVQKAIHHGVPVRSLYFWTLIDNLEWYKAWAVRFGFYSFNPLCGSIEPRPASAWIKDKILARNKFQEKIEQK